MIIGLTGKRDAGKSTFAKIAVNKFEFESIHAFGPGKAMIMAYYTYIGIDEVTAWEMVYGTKKDEYLGNMPEEDKNSRYFMEELGYLMGVKLGPKWTALQELKRVERLKPNSNKILESIVYELPIMDQLNDAIIIECRRPGHNGPAGTHTDAYVADIKPFITIINTTLEQYKHKCSLLIEALIASQGDYENVRNHFGKEF